MQIKKGKKYSLEFIDAIREFTEPYKNKIQNLEWELAQYKSDSNGYLQGRIARQTAEIRRLNDKLKQFQDIDGMSLEDVQKLKNQLLQSDKLHEETINLVHKLLEERNERRCVVDLDAVKVRPKIVPDSGREVPVYWEI